MSKTVFYPRYAERLLEEALVDSPVVLIHGPRQCGKTSLAQYVCAPTYLSWGDSLLLWGDHPLSLLSNRPRDYDYISFDDEVVRGGAKSDPMGFIDDLPDRVILDEVQRVPELFAALKLAVDRRRVPGRFVLAGSTNVLLIPKLSDSLAGRMQLVRLHPFAQCEIKAGFSQTQTQFNLHSRSGFLDALFGDGFKIRRTERLGKELAELIATGGYPAAIARPSGRRRAAWYRDYIEAQVQRDVQDLARIRALDTLPRLVEAAASQTSRLYNLQDLAAPFQLSRKTIGDYVGLLERVYLLERLPSWSNNRLDRLVKKPKLHIGDTGVGCAVLGVDAASLEADRTRLGQLLETFVFQELKKQASWDDKTMSFFHYRDKDQVEVDIVIERSSLMVAGIEVKAAATVTKSDFRGLHKLQKVAGERFAGGVVLYDGETTTGFGDKLYAVPIRLLWEMPGRP